jgi:hypothetical protein
MVIRHGRVTEASHPDVAGLLRDIVQQQTATLQVLAESVRLQRVLVERLPGVSSPQTGDPQAGSIAPTIASANPPSSSPAGVEPTAEVPSVPTAASETRPSGTTLESAPESPPAQADSDLPFAPAAADQNLARGARYYQPRPSPLSRSISPEELELMRRLQEMRDSSDLILQFGPHKGSTLAQVALSDPDYIRQLMRGAQRPEVRAAAGRLVQAMDAAAEHKPKTRTSARRGRAPR